MLTISRDDVQRDVITEFDPTTRFIKLPIQNYLNILTWQGKRVSEELNDPQRALINAINNPKYRFVVAALSRRLGKTFIANIIGQLVTLIPNCNVLIMSPNFTLSNISFDLQRKFIKQFELEVTKDNAKDRIIELENGSTIRMGSINTVDSCVGRSYDLIIFDEAALGADAESAFNVSLRPTLDKPNSKAIFISTPRGKNNWFSHFWNRGFDPKFPEWVSLHADYTENRRMKQSDVDEAKASMSQAEFEQEYLASFVTFEGQIYQLEDECIVEFEPQDNLEFIAGMDPGYKDPTAFVVIAFNPETQIYHIVDEYLEAEAVTSKHAERFKEFESKYNISAIFIDSAAPQFAMDLAYTYDIATIKAKKAVLEGIAFVQTLVQNNRILVDPKCKNVIEMFDQYQWDKRETLVTERPVHDKYSHMADAVRYALYSFTI
ncbi:XtmB Phage terminase large subunit [uncultured Caudovirales phage]|uniref:XtmB Phage terminase large subunit n=1 Tax=uncultured Caudovirales phage TaxID=2100421 RepID=A0A6J5LK01_9CAUD|nr:XtmB Phage terminase large subunit [uncultured Caudovirales phage]